MHYFLPKNILLQKHRDRHGRCIARLFKSIGVRGRFDSPACLGANKAQNVWMQVFLLTIGSFLLTTQFLRLQLRLEAFLLTIGAF